MAWIFLGKASFSPEAKHRKITWVVKILVDYQKGLEFWQIRFILLNPFMFSFAGFGFRASFSFSKAGFPDQAGMKFQHWKKPDGFQVAIFVGEN